MRPFIQKDMESGWFFLSNVQKQPSRGVLRKGALKIYSKFTGEHPCRSVISINLLINFFEITLWHWKDVLKICNKVTGKHPCQSVISIKLLSNFIEIKLRHGCSPVNLLQIFKHPSLRAHLEGSFRIKKIGLQVWLFQLKLPSLWHLNSQLKLKIDFK